VAVVCVRPDLERSHIWRPFCMVYSVHELDTHTCSKSEPTLLHLVPGDNDVEKKESINSSVAMYGVPR
jgi:hypothetical protein